MNVIHAAELLIEKVKTDYKDDIALVVKMGSDIYVETVVIYRNLHMEIEDIFVYLHRRNMDKTQFWPWRLPPGSRCEK